MVSPWNCSCRGRRIDSIGSRQRLAGGPASPGEIAPVALPTNKMFQGLASPTPSPLHPPPIPTIVRKCSRLKSSMPFKCDLALQNIPLSKQPFTTQLQIEYEDVTCSPQYNLYVTRRTNKRRASLSLQEVELDG